MPSIRPRTGLHNLTAGEFGFEVVAILCSLVVGGLTSRKYFLDEPPDNTAGTIAAAVTLLAALTLLWRAVARNRKAQNTTEIHALEGVLHTLQSIVANQRAGLSVRVCVHVISNKPDYLYQLTNYVGEDPPAGAKREILVSCGISGRACRTGAAHYDRLPHNTTVADYLVSEYGYQRDVANRVRQDRQAWAAIPVGVAGAVVAVIFLDSPDLDIFGRENCPLRKILQSAVLGVAEFIARP